MATVLMGWELGGGLGHVARLLPIARGLTEMGHRPVFVAKNLVEPAPLLSQESFPVLQAPFWHPRQWIASRPFVATSYADILAVRGFADQATLYPMVEAWQRLIDLTRPELIVSDYSPTLTLAAYGSVPVVETSNGFSMPPLDTATFPALVPDVQPVVPQEQLLEVVRQVQQERGRQVPETLTSFLVTAGRFIVTWPELDPYRAVRQETLWGPLQSIPLRARPPDRPSFFAYLAADYPAVHQILEQLTRAGLHGEVYLRSAVPALQARLQASGLIVHRSPPPMRDVLDRVSLILHHAGLGTAEAALAAGCPQLVFPRHLEQKLTADALVALGVGTYLTGKLQMDEIIQTARQLCGANCAEQARTVAQSLQQRAATNPLQQILTCCASLL